MPRPEKECAEWGAVLSVDLSNCGFFRILHRSSSNAGKSWEKSQFLAKARFSLRNCYRGFAPFE